MVGGCDGEGIAGEGLKVQTRAYAHNASIGINIKNRAHVSKSDAVTNFRVNIADFVIIKSKHREYLCIYTDILSHLSTVGSRIELWRMVINVRHSYWDGNGSSLLRLPKVSRSNSQIKHTHRFTINVIGYSDHTRYCVNTKSSAEISTHNGVPYDTRLFNISISSLYSHN